MNNTLKSNFFLGGGSALSVSVMRLIILLWLVAVLLKGKTIKVSGIEEHFDNEDGKENSVDSDKLTAELRYCPQLK